MEYFEVYPHTYVRVREEDYFAEYYEPGRGWIPNRHYVEEVFYNGGGDPLTEAEAMAGIAAQEAELVAA